MDEHRPPDADEPDDGFAWSSEPEPEWVEGIRDARRRRASQLAEELSSPDPAEGDGEAQ